jgi:hypothetical protein
MRLRAIIAAALLLGCSAQAYAEPTCKYRFDIDDETATWERQFAQCRLDATQYDDEHPVPQGITDDQVYQFVAKRWQSRFDGCMQAAGWRGGNHVIEIREHILAQWNRKGCPEEDIRFLEKDIADNQAWAAKAEQDWKARH